MKQNLPEHILESMRQGLSDEEAISEGLVDPLDLTPTDYWYEDEEAKKAAAEAERIVNSPDAKGVYIDF
jgi:hypothetical protein